jgi:hypothetical protein
MFLYFFQWFLYVSANQCYHQRETAFLSDPLQRQYGRRQVMERMVEPAYRRAMQRNVMVHYQVHTEVAPKAT